MITAFGLRLASVLIQQTWYFDYLDMKVILFIHTYVELFCFVVNSISRRLAMFERYRHEHATQCLLSNSSFQLQGKLCSNLALWSFLALTGC